MGAELDIKEALRYMLLPVPSDQEDRCIELVLGLFEGNAITKDAYGEYLKINYEAWKSDGTLDPVLKSVIEELLKLTSERFGVLFAEKYFDILRELVKNPFISFDFAVIILSHLRLIAALAKDEQMSAAKILKVIRSIDHRLISLPRKEVQNILRALRMLPEIDQEKAEVIYEEDERLQETYFADSDLVTAAYQVGLVAAKLQFSGDAEDLLKKLSTPEKVHLPYLQILHYQCLISGLYDHVLSVPYEFNPRGNVANWLFAKWQSLLHTSNPILNNAKAVDVLDENWAASKKTNEYEQAMLLVTLLKGLDGMGFVALQELTAWIRRWLIRFIKLNSTEVITVPRELSFQQLSKIVGYINSEPTHTYGILEQRLTDVLASYSHTSNDGWRPKGLGDSVNSNNLSKRKLGDCDFQKSEIRQIIAYESHGGILSKLYLTGHMRTLRRALLLRKEELESFADINEWNFVVIFVAYGFESNLPETTSIDGIMINIKYLTFKEFSASIDISSFAFSGNLLSWFIDQINTRRTPAFVRDKILDLIK